MKPIRILWGVTAGVAVLAVVFLSGCAGIIRDFPETRLFVIETPDVDKTGAGFQTGRGLLIRQFDISAEFESSFFIYKVSDNRFTNDYYNKFMVSPGRMITDAVRDALNDSVLFRLVPAGEPDQIDFRLSGKITHLYVDIRNPEQPEAVMALRLLLEKEAPAGFMPVINHVYSVSEPVPGTRSEAYVQAWNRCLAQVVTEFLTDAGFLK
ncbi:MAG: ABC-type transport auxiliary lipoprotein family protein [Desulfotignum sp.]|nr:ABC-type transport auxiliary lipoprotein family protein [Desulfotignum sp.]